MNRIIFLAFIILNISCFFSFPEELRGSGFQITGSQVIEHRTDGTYTAKADLKNLLLVSSWSGEEKIRQIKPVSGRYPVLKTGNDAIDLLYLMAIEELNENLTSFGYFSAGEKWRDCWTRDTSYAADLALNCLMPAQTRFSLLKRVRNGKVMQDPGSGGGFPVSNDRIVWLIAARGLLSVTGDPELENQLYPVMRDTLLENIQICFDSEFNLFRGESTFLDWREQSYPIWMEPADIGHSFSYSTNILHLQALAIMKTMSEQNQDQAVSKIFQDIYNQLSEGLKRFDLPGRSYSGSMIINGAYPFLYEGYDNLGESLCRLWFSGKSGHDVRPGRYGMPVIAPQTRMIDSYHNNAVWPFVSSYRIISAAKTGDEQCFADELAVIIRSALFFQTFKENMEADSGSPDRTVINSNRQLWSVAGYLGVLIRGVFGLEFHKDGINFHPFKLRFFNPSISLKRFYYRNAILDIHLEGYGDKIDAFYLDGLKQPSFSIPADLNGNHEIKIILNGFVSDSPEKKYYFDSMSFKELTPLASLEKEKKQYLMTWNQQSDFPFIIYRNGVRTADTGSGLWRISAEKKAAEYFASVSQKPLPYFKGSPVWLENRSNTLFFEAENYGDPSYRPEKKKLLIRPTNAVLTAQLKSSIYNGRGYLERFGKNKNNEISIDFQLKESSKVMIDFRYQNGHGPVNTGEKCGMMKVTINQEEDRTVLLPQRGSWMDWGFSAPLVYVLKKGRQKIILRIPAESLQPDQKPVTVNLDLMRVRMIE